MHTAMTIYLAFLTVWILYVMSQTMKIQRPVWREIKKLKALDKQTDAAINKIRAILGLDETEIKLINERYKKVIERLNELEKQQD